METGNRFARPGLGMGAGDEAFLAGANNERRAAATTVCWPLGTCARMFRMKCTRHLCQVAPRTRLMSALSPSWTSEMTMTSSPRRSSFHQDPQDPRGESPRTLPSSAFCVASRSAILSSVIGWSGAPVEIDQTPP